MDAKQMGKFISELRKDNGMTQVDLAKKLQVSDKAVSRWERGLGFPDISTLEPLAIALNVNLLELMQCEKMSDDKIQSNISTNAVNLTIDMAQQQINELFKNVVLYSVIGIIGVFSLIMGLVFHSYGRFSLSSRPILLCCFGIIMLLIFLIYLYRKIGKLK